VKLNKRNQIQNGVGRPEGGALLLYHWSSTVEPRRKRGTLHSQQEEAYFTAPSGGRNDFSSTSNSSQ